jgi:transposase
LIVDLARFMTLADIAGWLSLSWDTVRSVVQRRLEKDYQRIGDRKVHSIAIDELYLGRTHKYVTLVIDLESARIIWVEQGRGSQALREFWRRFKLSGARLKAVAMDMSGAYAASVRAHAPHAILTFDRFHIIKLMNERLDDLRRELAREAQDHRQLHAMAQTLLRHAKGVLSYYKTGLTSGRMEGINRKIRGLLASVFGFPDQDFLKLRLYALHEAKFKFVG